MDFNTKYIFQNIAPLPGLALVAAESKQCGHKTATLAIGSTSDGPSWPRLGSSGLQVGSNAVHLYICFIAFKYICTFLGHKIDRIMGGGARPAPPAY